jgi:hypothetical protein
MSCWRTLLALLLLHVSLSPVLAAEVGDPLPRYERAGAGFGCHTSKEDMEKAQTEKRDVCLRIGPLYVGISRADVEAQLGKPFTSVPAGTRTAFAYMLMKDEVTKQASYTVLTYDENGRADSVQVTGNAFLSPSGAWLFSGLSLGMSQDAVIARLGPPMQTRPSDDPGAVQWNYLPWTFSFEVKDGVVSSIRLSAH